jgi:uncharacterized protein YciI
MKRLFAVISSEGPAWVPEQPLESQPGWNLHADFMEALVADGFIVLGGPLEGTPDRLLVVRASSPEEIRERLAADPWTIGDLLRVTRVAPWTLRLGRLP